MIVDITNLSNINRLGAIGTVTLVLLALAVIAFLTFALLALFARSDAKTGGSPRRLIYFGHVVRFTEAVEYVREFRTLTPDEALDDLAYQIVEVSHIASKKFANYRRAWTALLVELFVFVVLVAFVCL